MNRKNLNAAKRLFKKNFLGSDIEKDVKKELSLKADGFIGGTTAAHRVHGMFGKICTLMGVELGRSFFSIAEAEAVSLCLREKTII